MGNDISKTQIGPKSQRIDSLKLSDAEIDYKQEKNAGIAKKELYDLFLDDKIVHVSKIEEALDKIEIMKNETDSLKQELENYKKFNKTNDPSISKVPTEIKLENIQSIDQISRQMPNDISKDDIQSRISRIAKKIKEAQRRVRES